MSKKKPTAPALAEGQVEARVLTDCAFGVANDVIVLTAEEAQQAAAGGLVDTDPDAVAYAVSLQDGSAGGDAALS